MSSTVRTPSPLFILHADSLPQNAMSSDVEAAKPELCSRLDDYTLKFKLGEGGYGSAWLAETVLDGERALVVIKAINRAKAAGLHSSFDSICVERELMHRISTEDKFGDFPHMIETFDDAYNTYFVMVSTLPTLVSSDMLTCSQEYMPGMTLLEELNRSGGALSEARVRYIMAQLVRIPLLPPIQ